MLNQISLKDKTAVVTGGGRGLGHEFAVALASAGATVAVTGRNEAPLASTVERIKAMGGEAVAVVFDIACQEEADRGFAWLQNALGPIDILVNSAGHAGPIDYAWDTDPDDWWKTFEINVRGSFLCSRAVLPTMVSRREGSIINIVSQAGIHRWPLCSAYAVSKSALIKMSENLAAEVRRSNVSIYSYHPGLLKIGLTETLLTADLDPDSPRGKVANWFHRQFEEDRLTSTELSVVTLLALASGRYAALSGRFIAAGDDLTQMLGAVSAEEGAGLYLLALKS